MQPLPPAAYDVAAKASPQGFCSMPKPQPAGARPRPASCHVATVSKQSKFFDQPMIVVVNAMLAEYLRTSSIGFLLHSRKIANILRLRDIADSSKRNTSGNFRLREIAIPRTE